MGDHDVVAVTRLGLDDQIVRAVVQVGFASVREQVFADVCSAEPGDVCVDEVLLQLALELDLVLDGARPVGEDRVDVFQQHPVAAHHAQPAVFQVLVHRPIDVAVAVSAVERQEALVDGPAGLVPGVGPAE
ncbi:hypothetical protein AAFP35_11435 [Gordonia sp. CPCC 206044]|uniref:hypothetical protein n=1 Tax=Gordonia sp. CPCC 206044 TaxID=3140793 RepID=UPI003AF38F10